MTDGQSLVDKKLQVRANFFFYGGIGRRGSLHRQAGWLPSEVRARHGESSTGLAGDSEA